MRGSHRIIIGDCRAGLRSLPERSVHCVVTSPPYFGLRDYGVDGQVGLEASPAEFVAAMVEVFADVHRVLRDDGACFVNLGDSYNAAGRKGHGTRIGYKQGTNRASATGEDHCRPNVQGLKPKDLIGIPWRVAFALQEWGWYLRQDIVWAKTNAMPESVRDRCSKSHEYVFLLTKSERYFWDQLAIATPTSAKTMTVRTTPRKGEGHESTGEKLNDWMENNGGRQYPSLSNRRSVWQISTQSFKGAHFATFPERIPELCIKAGTSEKGCCPTCGKPWARITDKIRRPTRPGEATKVSGRNSREFQDRDPQHDGDYKADRYAMEVGNRDPQRHVTETITVGWRQSCKCPAHDPVPSVVCDPFTGSGTTAQVATWLGRDFVGCELNPDYAVLAEARIASPPRFTKRKTPKPRKKKERQGELFDAHD